MFHLVFASSSKYKLNLILSENWNFVISSCNYPNWNNLLPFRLILKLVYIYISVSETIKWKTVTENLNKRKKLFWEIKKYCVKNFNKDRSSTVYCNLNCSFGNSIKKFHKLGVKFIKLLGNVWNSVPWFVPFFFLLWSVLF